MQAYDERALDTLDYHDALATVSGSGWTGGSYHVNGTNGWDGPTGFYSDDHRRGIHRGETKTWMLYIWAAPEHAPNDLALTWGANVNSDPLVLARLELFQKPAGVTGGPDVGTVWTAPLLFTLPFYSTSDGLTAYGFRFTLSMIPEPSSLTAILAGLAGFGAVMRRRRRG